MYLNNSNKCAHCGHAFDTERQLRDHLSAYAGHCATIEVDDHFDEHPEEEYEYQPTEDEISRY